MAKFPNRYSTFRTKLTFAFILTSMIPLLLSIYVAIFIFNDYLEKDSVRTLSSHADLEAQQMENKLEQILNMQDSLAVVLSSYLTYGNAAENRQISTPALAQFQFLKQSVSNLEYVYGISRIRVYSDWIPFTSGDDFYFFPIKKLDDNLYRQVVKQSSGINRLDVLYRLNSDTSVSFYKTIKNVNGDIIAIYFIDMDIGNMVRQLLPASQDEISMAVLNGQEVLYHSSSTTKAVPEIASGSFSANRVYSVSNNNYQMKKSSAFTNWYYLFTLPKKTLQGNNFVIFYGYFSVFLFTVALCLVAIIIFPYSLSKRIKRFSQIIDDIHDNDLISTSATEKIYAMLPSQDPSKNEIDTIIYSFYNLFQKNIQLNRSVQEHMVEVERSKFTVLQEQINPHFLYNSLDTIRICMLAGQKDTAADLIKSLSQFYRISLSKGKDIICIKDELDMISSYLQIEYIGYDHHIKWDFSYAPELGRYSIPKFTLQPIVENSIVHNDFSDPDFILFIKIKLLINDEKLSICISDNGSGLSSQQIEKLNLQLSAKDLTPSGSYGLQNCCQRIRLHYGSDYGIQLLKPEIGCCVHITLPLHLLE